MGIDAREQFGPRFRTQTGLNARTATAQALAAQQYAAYAAGTSGCLVGAKTTTIQVPIVNTVVHILIHRGDSTFESWGRVPDLVNLRGSRRAISIGGWKEYRQFEWHKG
jgi:hypothetical protein